MTNITLHYITLHGKLQGRLVLALILVQLQKGDSVAASKVSLPKLSKGFSLRLIGFLAENFKVWQQ